jgi:alkaline phosphatase
VALVLSLAPCAPQAATARRAVAPRPAPEAGPRSLVLFIADGAGPATFALARLVAGRPLALDSILVGAATTASSDALVTDSAAGATAYAAGVRTYNAGISVDPEHRALGTLLEAAEARGMATGLVATSRITHATPAAFAAHVDSRTSENEIAAQMMAQGIEVVLGGGRRHFVPRASGGRRDDGRDLVAEARDGGAEVVSDRAGLAAVARPPVLGLFAEDHMRYALDADTLAKPSLAEMTRRALALLARDPDGFLLVVEGSRIDHAAHSNWPAATARETLEHDAAVAEALGFARRDGGTLVVSVADHETGGLPHGRRVGSTDRADLDVAPLRRAAMSEEALAARLRGGAAIDSALRAAFGIDALEPEERRLLAEGVQGQRPLGWMVGEVVSRRARVGWTTGGHTAADVGVYAWGPGRERLAGVRENAAVGRVLADLLGLDLGAATERLRAERPVVPHGTGTAER